ncbi:MAG: hypothetical protein IJO91_00860 [Oscillospiraceae bacterium]|nr:hypothetical protein [Oscillospiraceae bacterium]
MKYILPIVNCIVICTLSVINKMVTLLSVVLLTGCIYEFATGNTISDRTGDIMALAVGAIGIVMWVYDYYIKPFRKSK